MILSVTNAIVRAMALHSVTPKEPARDQISRYFAGAKSWFRGPATIDGDFIELDLDQAEHVRVSSYDVEMALDLANLRSESDVVDFVGKYGLLASPPGSKEYYREKVSDFLFTAWNLSLALVAGRAVVDASDPQNDRAAQSLDRLRTMLTEDLAIDAREIRQDRDLLLRRWSSLVSTMLNAGMQNIRPVMFDECLSSMDTEAGAFTFMFEGPTLRDFAYFRIARLLTDEVGASECPGCGILFQPSDKRQLFHDKACANRNRQKEWRKRRR